jgi:hypothetical protein
MGMLSLYLPSESSSSANPQKPVDFYISWMSLPPGLRPGEKNLRDRTSLTTTARPV